MVRMTASLRKKLRATTCWIYDFDGVMTDNRVLVLADGGEAVFCHRGDGWAIKTFRELGHRQFILSTEENPIVMRRAEKLRLPCLHGLADKKAGLLQCAQKENIDLRYAAYVGNDENDREAMRMVNLKIAPADASADIRRLADLTCRSKGGYGVLRELLEIYRFANEK